MGFAATHPWCCFAHCAKTRGRGVWVPAFAGTTTRKSLPRFRRLLEPARQHRPIAGGAKTLQQIHEAGVVADQDARLVVLDALDDAERSRRGRGFCDAIEPLDRLRAALIVGHACPGAGIADDVGGDPAGCTTDNLTGLAAACNSCRRLSEKPRTANFAAA
jgi:hypothetical protein